MTRKGCGIFVSTTFFYVVVVTSLSCAHTPSQQQLAAAPAPTPPVIQKPADALNIVFERPRVKFRTTEWWPIKVVDVIEGANAPHLGDWLIEIRNVSDKPVTSVEMLNAGPTCSAFAMSGGVWAGLGFGKPFFTKPAKPSFDPGKSDVIVFKRMDLNETFPPDGFKECPQDQTYSIIELYKVAYTGGTVWEPADASDDPNRRE